MRIKKDIESMKQTGTGLYSLCRSSAISEASARGERVSLQSCVMIYLL